MQTAKQQSWKLSINAKFNNVHFKFNARNRNPTWKLLKFSLFLKLQESIFQVNTKFRTSIPKKQTSLKSKCLQFFRKFKTSSAKKQPIAAQKSPILENPESKIPSSALNRSTIKEPIFSGSLFIGTLALLTKSISEKNQKGAIIHGDFLKVLSISWCVS
ncbi:conserved hypothetical protein [Ricinus communis]|uniref:Uncharacterized protein n=1 Tax=Ricinus communis TaxID=3988 RepID=B9SRS2_RICCO|nr:conserved hypothetical protein [Ricinus communis]